MHQPLSRLCGTMEIGKVSQIRLLLWLRWKLAMAMLRTRGQRIAAAFAAIFLGIPMAVGAAIFVGFILLMLRRHNETALCVELVRYVLVMIYIMWLTIPLIGFSQNESYDLSRALLYPISAKRLAIAAFLGGFIDPWTLLAIPTLIVIAIFFSTSVAAAPIVVCALILFVFHTVGLSQTISHAMLGFLQSRRFRDIATVLIPAIVLGLYLLQQAGMRQIDHLDPEAFLRQGHSRFLSFLPTNLFTMAITRAGEHPLAALGWALGGLACAAVTVALGAWMIERLYDGTLDTSSGRARKRVERIKDTRVGLLDRVLPGDFVALLRKDLRYFWRHPIVKNQLIGVLYMAGIMAISAWSTKDVSESPQLRAFTSLSMMIGVFFVESQIAFNMFGIDGPSASILFLSPMNRRRIMAAKATYTAIILCCINVVLVSVGGLLSGTLVLFLPMLTYVILASVLYVGGGCIMSAHYPMQVVAWFGKRTAGRRVSMGFLQSLVYMAAALAVLLATVPIGAAAFLPHLIHRPIWLALTMPLAVAYSIVLLIVGVKAGGVAISEREYEITDAVGPCPAT